MGQSDDFTFKNFEKQWSKAKNTYIEESKKEYTQEQVEAVRLLSNCKNYYQLLNVNENANESDLKKQFRKLALQFHPDKNKAPGASETFKAIKNAFIILKDPIKRKDYDSQRLQAELKGHSYFQDSKFFCDDISSEETFNIFFSGKNFYLKKNNHWTNPESNNIYQDFNIYNILFQLLPVIILVFLSLFSSFFIKDPLYNLTKTSKYSVERKTAILNLPYFVKENFNEAQTNLAKIEEQVNTYFIQNLRKNCFRETNYRENMIWKAKKYSNSAFKEKVENIKTPSCDQLQKIQKNFDYL